MSDRRTLIAMFDRAGVAWEEQPKEYLEEDTASAILFCGVGGPTNIGFDRDGRLLHVVAAE